MKPFLILISCLAFAAGCSKVEDSALHVYHAVFEQTETKTFVDDELHLYWTYDDRLSIFEGVTYNKQFQYIGETGYNSADIFPVNTGGYSSGEALTSNVANYAIYPYKANTRIDYDGAISFTFPAVQQYAPGTFGLGANTMVAVTANTDDKFLAFKNVGAFIVFKFYGDGTVIRSIALTSQAGEPLAGKATITASHSAPPSLSPFVDDANRTPTLTLDCGEGVGLAATAAEAGSFWFVIPPGTLSNGFALTVTGTDGSTVTRTSSGSRTYERNTIYRFPALEIKFSNPSQAYSGNGISNLSEIGFDW